MRSITKTPTFILGFAISFFGLSQSVLSAELEESASAEALRLAPSFKFDQEVCFPAPAIFREGTLNPGLDVDGTIKNIAEESCQLSPLNWIPGLCPSNESTNDCRDIDSDLLNANTYYRSVCSLNDTAETLCAHVYALYFEKDEIAGLVSVGDSGHRHDWEFVVVWTKGGELTHASRSAHGDLVTRELGDLPLVDQTHVRVVVHKEMLDWGDAGVDISGLEDVPFGLEATASLRFAHEGETSGEWYTPPVVDWFEMAGEDGVSNADLRAALSPSDAFGNAHFPLSDEGDEFVRWFTDNDQNNAIPDGYENVDFWRDAVKADIQRRKDKAIEDAKLIWEQLINRFTPKIDLIKDRLKTVAFLGRKIIVASTAPDNWVPKYIVYGFETGDGQSLDGLKLEDVDGNTYELTGWWVTIQRPFNSEGNTLIIPSGQSDRHINIRWWYSS